MPSFLEKKFTCDHYSLANIWAMYLQLPGILCLQRVRSAKVAQGYEQSGLRPGDNQAYPKAAAEQFCSSTQVMTMLKLRRKVTEDRPLSLRAPQE